MRMALGVRYEKEEKKKEEEERQVMSEEKQLFCTQRRCTARLLLRDSDPSGDRLRESA
tara:strand:- start:228 stop:401 length:174 start_codon:yes stop_codon:yes gene_type:complete